MRITNMTFIDPRAMRCIGDIFTVVNGVINICGRDYKLDKKFTGKAELRLKNNDFWLEDYSIVLKEQSLRAKKREAQRIAEAKRLEQREIELHEKAALFWQSYNIPFLFKVGIKEVLSGLSESSWGDGARKNSKTHIILDEPISIGRLKRNSSDFLCSQQANIANWSHQNNESLVYQHPLSGDAVNLPITCKSCLKKISKYICSK